MLSFCLRVLNMSPDLIINYSIFGKVTLGNAQLECRNLDVS